MTDETDDLTDRREALRGILSEPVPSDEEPPADSGEFEVHEALLRQSPQGAPRRSADDALSVFVSGTWVRFLRRYDRHALATLEQMRHIDDLKRINIAQNDRLHSLESDIKRALSNQDYVLSVLEGTPKHVGAKREGGLVDLVPGMLTLLRMQHCVLKTIRWVLVPLAVAVMSAVALHIMSIKVPTPFGV